MNSGIKQADARAHCKKHGMDLPMLKTPFEGWLWKKEISGLINNMAWIGSTRGMSHTEFIWNDGTPNDLAPSTSEECLTVMADGTFFAKPCSDTSAVFQVICQGKLDLLDKYLAILTLLLVEFSSKHCTFSLTTLR